MERAVERHFERRDERIPEEEHARRARRLRRRVIVPYHRRRSLAAHAARKAGESNAVAADAMERWFAGVLPGIAVAAPR